MILVIPLRRNLVEVPVYFDKRTWDHGAFPLEKPWISLRRRILHERVKLVIGYQNFCLQFHSCFWVLLEPLLVLKGDMNKVTFNLSCGVKMAINQIYECELKIVCIKNR